MKDEIGIHKIIPDIVKNYADFKTQNFLGILIIIEKNHKFVFMLQMMELLAGLRIRIRSDPECFPQIRIRYYHSGSGSDQYDRRR